MAWSNRPMMLVLASLVLAGCGKAPTENSIDGAVALNQVAASATLTHPKGQVFATTSLGGRPFGLAVGDGGTMYVTQLDVASMGRGTLPSTAFPISVSVGSIPTNVAFGGGRAYVTNQGDRTVGFIDPQTNTQVATLAISGNPFNAAFAAGSRHLFVTNNSSSVYVIDPATRTLLASVNVGGVSNGIATNAAGTRVYVSLVQLGQVLEIDATTNAVLRVFATGGIPQGLAVAKTGEELYVADETGPLQIWSLTTGLKLASVTLPAGGFGLALSPDQAQLYVGMPGGAGVAIVSRSSRTLLTTIAVGGTPRRVAFNSRGDTAVITNEAGYVTFVR